MEKKWKVVIIWGLIGVVILYILLSLNITSSSEYSNFCDVPLSAREQLTSTNTQLLKIRNILTINHYGLPNINNPNVYEDYFILPISGSGSDSSNSNARNNSVDYFNFNQQIIVHDDNNNKITKTTPQKTTASPIISSGDDNNEMGYIFGLIDGKSEDTKKIERQRSFHTKNVFAKSLQSSILAVYDGWKENIGGTNNNNNHQRDPSSLLCEALLTTLHKEGEVAIALGMIKGKELTVLSIGDVVTYIVSFNGYYRRIESNERKGRLKAGGSGLSSVTVQTQSIAPNDIIIMATNGVTDNFGDDRLYSLLYTLNNNEKNKAKLLTETAAIIALGVGSTPFSIRAAMYGLIIEGGRSDDASAIVMNVQQISSVNN